MSRARTVGTAPEYLPPPPWKVVRCPCGRDVKIYYNGALVPATKWEWSREALDAQVSFEEDPKKYVYVETLTIIVYGVEIVLHPGEYYFVEYKEVPYAPKS